MAGWKPALRFNYKISQWVGCLLPYHCQEHFEFRDCCQRMRLIGWHDDRVTTFQVEWLARNAHFHFTIQYMHECIKRRGVLTQLLALIEGKERDVACIFFGDLPADNRTLLIGGKV